jgi:tRNA (cmo5U34)-methyltransferase
MTVDKEDLRYVEGDLLSPSMVHTPDGLFSFDGKVAEIFDDMAVRSIPMYKEAHRLHASLLHAAMVVKTKEDPYRILDVGASRGGFLEEVCNQFHSAKTTKLPNIEATAVDTSPRMCDLLKRDMPWVTVLNEDIADQGLSSGDGTYDLITVFYTLQFIPPESRGHVLALLHSLLKPGGVLVIGAKSAPLSYTGDLDREYYRWRLGNGYSLEEIHQKTKALEGSMWVEPLEQTVHSLRLAGFHDIQETTRWCQFSTVIARKEKRSM